MASTIATVQDWGKRRVLQPVATVIKIVNGQAAHDETKAFMLEIQTVQTAMATRIVWLESRVRLLTVLCAVLLFVEVLHWIVR
jgi:hypothetical protein